MRKQIYLGRQKREREREFETLHALLNRILHRIYGYRFRNFRRQNAHLSVRLENGRGMAWSVCRSGTWPGRVRWKLHPSSANFGAKRYRVAQEEAWIVYDL